LNTEFCCNYEGAIDVINRRDGSNSEQDRSPRNLLSDKGIKYEQSNPERDYKGKTRRSLSQNWQHRLKKRYQLY